MLDNAKTIVCVCSMVWSVFLKTSHDEGFLAILCNISDKFYRYHLDI